MNQINLLKIAKKVRSAMINFTGQKKLSGYCAVASFLLAEVLQKAQVIKGCVKHGKFSYYDLEDHFWVFCNGYSIDITASQFKFLKNDINIFKSYQNMKLGYYFVSMADYDECQTLLYPPNEKQTKYLIKKYSLDKLKEM